MSGISNRNTIDARPREDEPTDGRVRRAVSRLETAVERKPGFGRSTMISNTVLTDGLRCTSRENGHVVVTDLGPALGGNDSGPTPGALLRAALGSCLTMGYRIRAARHGIAVDAIRVEIETDSEIEGMLAADSVFPPGYTEVRYRVAIDSPASDETVEQLIVEADRLSPLLDAVTRANRVVRLPSTSSAGGGDR